MAITLDGTTGVTAAEFDGTVDASNLTGILPAIDGSALTSLTAGNLTGTLPAIDGSALTGVVAGLGVDQTWQNVIGSRSGSDTAYQNTTGKPICVHIEDDANADFSVSSNGSSWMDFPLTNAYHPLSAVIPDGYYYRWSGPSPTEWLELR